MILTNLAGVHSSNIHTKFEGNPYSSLREVENVKKFKTRTKLHLNHLISQRVIFCDLYQQVSQD